jgi:hypothetical protein
MRMEDMTQYTIIGIKNNKNKEHNKNLHLNKKSHDRTINVPHGLYLATWVTSLQWTYPACLF